MLKSDNTRVHALLMFYKKCKSLIYKLFGVVVYYDLDKFFLYWIFVSAERKENVFFTPII